MLYHQRGIDYTDDPYYLEEIAAYEDSEGLRSGYFRDGIKAMVQVLINDQNGEQPEQIAPPDYVSFKPAFKRLEVRQMIEKKHALIADAFGTGAGLHLQRKDSDLALSIITELQEKGIVVLPVHESFITDEENKDVLLDSINNNYISIFGYNPIIK